MAAAELLSEQQRLERLEARLSKDGAEWQRRAENAVSQGRDDLARAALKARTELSDQHESVVDEQKHIAGRIEQMEQDMLTLKAKLAESKTRLKSMQAGTKPGQVKTGAETRLSPGERKVKRAMERFDHLQAQVDNLEARVRSYEVGGSAASAWNEAATEPADPEIEKELDRIKQRLADTSAAQAEAGEGEVKA